MVILLAVIQGVYWVKVITAIVGILSVDEVFCNFLKRKRFSFNYFLSQFILFISLFTMWYFNLRGNMQGLVLGVALLENFLLLYFLFFIDMKTTIFKKISDRYSFLSSIAFIPLIWTIFLILSMYNWRPYFLIYLLIVVAMDTGGWFFGKHFGKTLLCKNISPSKTIEGLIGGILFSGVIGSLLSLFFLKNISIPLFLLFSAFGLLSHLGDLIVSKFKRIIDIKDSSGLIPGHGGFCDRIDSIFFLAPFFLMMVKYKYL